MFKKALLMFASVFFAASPAFAAVDITGITFSLSQHEALAALMLAAVAGIWLIKSLLRLPGRG